MRETSGADPADRMHSEHAMCGEAKDSIIRENAALEDIDRAIDRLSHELSCLSALGALTAEENDALTAFLEDLRGLLARIRQAEAPADTDLPELSRMTRLFAVDLDRVYQRLYFAA